MNQYIITRTINVYKWEDRDQTDIDVIVHVYRKSDMIEDGAAAKPVSRFNAWNVRSFGSAMVDAEMLANNAKALIEAIEPDAKIEIYDTQKRDVNAELAALKRDQKEDSTTDEA